MKERLLITTSLFSNFYAINDAFYCQWGEISVVFTRFLNVVVEWEQSDDDEEGEEKWSIVCMLEKRYSRLNHQNWFIELK